MLHLYAGDAKTPAIADNPWKTITRRPNLVTIDDFNQIIADEGYAASVLARLALAERLAKILHQSRVAQENWEEYDDFDEPLELELYRLNTSALTMKDKATTLDIYEGVRLAGGTMCDPLNAFFLRFAYPEQPVGERLLFVAPVIAIQQTEVVFSITHDTDALSINVQDSDGLFQKKWNADTEWVFAKRRPLRRTAH